jgi:hypothetical protein
MRTDKKVQMTGAPVKPMSMLKLHKQSTHSVKTPQGIKQIVDISDLKYPKKGVEYQWLRACADKYQISSDIKDYVIVAVPLITSDIPNRNSQCFTIRDLVEFDTDHGRVRYRTFVGKPTFYDHNNTDIKASWGVNLDSVLIPVKKYGVHKVVVLSAFDRSKNSKKVGMLASGDMRSFSMGALAAYFQCSICAGFLGPSINKRSCSCHGTDYKNLTTLGKVVNGKVHYHMAKGFVYNENSLVPSPADPVAISDMEDLIIA